MRDALRHIRSAHGDGLEQGHVLLRNGPHIGLFVRKIPRHQHLIRFKQCPGALYGGGFGLHHFGVVGEFVGNVFFELVAFCFKSLYVLPNLGLNRRQLLFGRRRHQTGQKF